MWQYNYTSEPDELMHYGVLGQKWGVRRSEAQLARNRKKTAKGEPDHEDYAKAHTPKSVRSMSDTELNARNKRLNAEAQYKNLTKKTSVGQKIVKGITTAASTVTAVTAAYKVLKPVVSKSLDKVGGFFVKDVNITSVH